jgi:hypothetical protein
VAAVLVVSAFAVAAEQRRVVVEVPCGHLTAKQCETFTALADEFMPGYFDVPVMKSTTSRFGSTCPDGAFEALERCYFDQMAARKQPIGDHIRLAPGEAALVVLLFDPSTFPRGEIVGSSLVVARGGDLTLSSFSIHPADVVTAKGPRSVYIVRGGSLGSKELPPGLRSAPRPNGRFATSTTSWLFGDLAVDRQDQ